MCYICSLRNTGASLGSVAGDVPSAPLTLPSSHTTLTQEQIATGAGFLRRWPTVDIHAHPGRFFMDGAPPTRFSASLPPPFVEQAIAEIAEGGLSSVVFAAVADHLLLDSSDFGLRAVRKFAPGEAYADYFRQIAIIERLVRENRIVLATDADAVIGAHGAGRQVMMLSVEGGDFIEDRLQRLSEAHAQGVRAITIIHYHTNQIGDTQTETPTHDGLTPLGRDIVLEMNRLGILVDLSHASVAASRQAAEVSTRPMLFSHSNLAASAATHPRLVNMEHARLVTDQGGLMGVVPAGFGQATFEEYLTTILRMADALGIDHLAIGTDMDFTYRPVFTRYRDWAMIPAGLLARGMHEEEVAKVMGGNYLRLLGTARATGEGWVGRSLRPNSRRSLPS